MTILRAFWLAVLAAVALLGAQAAQAQTTITADWTNLNRNNFQEVPNGTVLDLGVNAITIGTARVTNGNGNDANFTPYYSPTGMLSYYTGAIGAQTGPLLYNMDHTTFDGGDYLETTYTFANTVTNLRFTLSHIDRNANSHDAVVIEYDTGTGVWANLRDLAAATITRGATVATVDTYIRGWHGTASAGGATSTTGNLAVNFNGTTVKRIRIRYLFGQDTARAAGTDPAGGSQYMGLSDFVWTQSVSTSDLSLTGTAAPANPAAGASVTYTLTLSNGGPQSALGVTVASPLPSGFTYVSSSATSGSFNPATGVWSGIAIASGATRTLTITGTANAPSGVTITSAAEVSSSPNYDPDSIPNNYAAEDDRATLSFTMAGARSAGVAPALACAPNTTIFEWNLNPWTAGSLNNSYTQTGIGAVNFTVTSTGSWVDDPTFGGMSPSLSNSNTGGIAGTRPSLHQYLDFNNQAETATTVITLPTAVPGAQFTVFDIDYAANDFADKLTVTGSFQGTPVSPVLTNGTSNYVIGNSAFGDAGSAGDSGAGNVVVTFNAPVDTITIIYGNHSTAPANPDGQAIAIYDITFCRPSAVLGITKLSTLISDPVNGVTNPKHIPGAVVEYCILVQNPGSGTATGLSGTDTLLPTLAFTPGSLTSGTSCAAATTAEDDNATGPDEADPHGASISGSTITATAASLAPGANFALKFRATVN